MLAGCFCTDVEPGRIARRAGEFGGHSSEHAMDAGGGGSQFQWGCILSGWLSHAMAASARRKHLARLGLSLALPRDNGERGRLNATLSESLHRTRADAGEPHRPFTWQTAR